MPSEEIHMQSYYAARAREYDRVYDKPERQADLRALRQWLPALFQGRRVLELACGTGYWTREIAPVAQGVVALDSEPETIAIARSRVPRDKVEFIVGNAYSLPRDRGPFDAAFAGFWFSHVPRRRQAAFVRGLAAAVGAGATVVMVDNIYVDGSSTPISERDADGNTFQTRQLEDGSVHRVLKNFPTEADLSAIVEDTGHMVQFRRFKYYWAVRYVTREVGDSASA